MFKKSILLLASLFAVGAAFGAAQVSANAEEVQGDAAQSRTLIITAKGDLTGSLVPYYDKSAIPGLDTGYIDLHYKSHDTGFVDGDYSYLTIELPQEFATIAKQASFKQNISGRVQRKGLLGDRWFTYSQNDIVVNGTQISFKTPRELWFIHGEVNADISINYGEVQKNYPIRLIKNSAERYTFKAALRRSMAPWDPMQYPLLGSNSCQWASDYYTAYWD
jgi:hypothetical protein